MEETGGIAGYEERDTKEIVSAVNDSTPALRGQAADPVVYQLVRVDGNGRLIPATEDEVMAVENLLESNKVDGRVVLDAEETVECITDHEYHPNINQSKEGLPQLENPEADAEKVTLPPYLTEDHKKVQANISPSASTAVCDGVETGSPKGCSKPSDGLVENGCTPSSCNSSSKPNFSMLKGEICLDNLTVRELQETFRAAFGRETSVKDKRWLKRRITMGLTNSCDFSVTSFIVEDNKVVKKVKQETYKRVGHALMVDSMVESITEKHGPATCSDNEKEIHPNATLTVQNCLLDDCGSEDVNMEQRAAKRVRKPTKRYIEELSEGESKDSSLKVDSSSRNSTYLRCSQKVFVRPLQDVVLNKRLHTRQESLGGSGIQVPYVSRIRRSRPRENFMSLMLNENAWYTERKAIEMDNELEMNNFQSFEDNPGDDVTTVPTPNGGLRRKHHRPWTLSEVVKLVEGVAKYGAGRWSEIKRVAFASYSYRTSVDLKDKWRNLLRASIAQLPAGKEMMTSRRHGSMLIPASVLSRVRELAETQAQVCPTLSSGEVAGETDNSRSVHETRLGFL